MRLLTMTSALLLLIPSVALSQKMKSQKPTKMKIMPILAQQIDTSKSVIEWKGSKVVGSSHNGKIKIKSGEVNFNGDKPMGANVVIDMNSITNDDLPKKKQPRLVGHLKSDDFFDVKKYPEAKLSLNKFKKKTKTSYEVSGTLTLKNKTKPISFIVKSANSKTTTSQFTANLTIDRTKWDVRYGSGKFFKGLGDKMISDDIELKVTLALKGQVKLGAL